MAFLVTVTVISAALAMPFVALVWTVREYLASR